MGYSRWVGYESLNQSINSFPASAPRHPALTPSLPFPLHKETRDELCSAFVIASQGSLNLITTTHECFLPSLSLLPPPPAILCHAIGCTWLLQSKADVAVCGESRRYSSGWKRQQLIEKKRKENITLRRWTEGRPFVRPGQKRLN